MFEKEAEEYVMREDVITENDRVPFDNGYGFQTVSFEDEVKKGFQDGAEFGYNKAKVEVEDSYRESLCNSELNLASVTEQLEELEKAYNETEELLDKQIEATYKVVEENKDQLTYAKTIIQDLLENTDEYARQRAEDFLKENK